VRLTSALGAALSNEVAQTRAILERFQKGGFDAAIWAVSDLPEKDGDIAPWTKTCLRAFPGNVIVALDAAADAEGGSTPARPRLQRFLAAACGSGPGSPPVSILLNYTRMSNCTKVENGRQAIEAAEAHGRLVREVLPGTFAWLLLDDDSTCAGRIPEWVRAVGDLADGYYLDRGHGVKALDDDSFAATARPLLASGKPVIRGGFCYASPRVRPGIEEDLREQYRERMSRYEQWIAHGSYAGYSRLVGESIPNETSVNMDYAPQGD
jgi:hypothetical protein